MLRRPAALAVALVLVGAGAGAAQAVPIPQDPQPSDAPEYVGHPAHPRPYWVPRPPQHPHMSADPGNNIHDDAYMTDSYRRTGPLGVEPTSTSTLQAAECASLTFDSRGRIETVCVGLTTPTLKLLDPVTLEEIASYDLPDREPSTDTFSDFSGGGYFYLDDRDRAVVPTTSRHIQVVGQTKDRSGFRLVKDYDLTSVVADDDKIMSAIPDWHGDLYFVTLHGIVGLVEPATGRIESLDLEEEIANSFAVDEHGGVYVVTAAAMYRVDTARDGKPRVTWRQVYENSGVQKPGQVSAGSGTTPTVMDGGLVAITDNADPMNVVVYRTAARPRADRLVCTVPVFEEGSSATDNSLIAAGRALVVTNNYGYAGPVGTTTGSVPTPGITRLDVDRDRDGCHVVWENTEERSPSAVPKVSLANGLVYTVGLADEDPGDEWYLVALDFRTGERVYKYRYGTGFGFNNNYAPVSLGDDGSAYVGVLGGLVRIADSMPPRVPDVRPQLRLAITKARSGEREARVLGPSREWVERAVFRVGGARVHVDRTSPYVARVAGNGKVSVRVRMSDETRVTLPR